MLTLEAIIKEPPIPAKSCVIWLHGLGADGNDFVDLIPALGLPEYHDIRFVFPHAPVRPVTINANIPMRAWFDIKSLTDLDQEDESGIRDSTQAVNALIEQQIEQGIAAKNIILAGFSQGGAIALFAALRFPQQLGGIIGLSTYLPLADALPAEASPENKTTPIFLAHGTLDDVLPVLLGKLSAQALQNLKYRVEWHEYIMGHQVNEEEIEMIGTWLNVVMPA